MSAYHEPTPSDQPFSGANKILKGEIAILLENFVYRFEHEGEDSVIMSSLLHLNKDELLLRAKEVGGRVDLHMQGFIQRCSDFANGQGKKENVYQQIKQLRKDLRS